MSYDAVAHVRLQKLIEEQQRTNQLLEELILLLRTSI